MFVAQLLKMSDVVQQVITLHVGCPIKPVLNLHCDTCHLSTGDNNKVKLHPCIKRDCDLIWYSLIKGDIFHATSKKLSQNYNNDVRKIIFWIDSTK